MFLGQATIALDFLSGITRSIETGPNRYHDGFSCFSLLCDVNVQDFDVFFGFFLVRPDALDFLNNIKALSGSSKNGMLTIQPGLSIISTN